MHSTGHGKASLSTPAVGNATSTWALASSTTVLMQVAPCCVMQQSLNQPMHVVVWLAAHPQQALC